MKLLIVSPAPAPSLSGNRVTVLRWARLLRQSGHRVRILSDWHGERCDALIALHARKCGRAALRFRAAHPSKPLVVAMGGTDLYRDLARSTLAQRACEAADRIVVLHRRAAADLPAQWRGKTRVILQSAEASPKSAGTRPHPRAAGEALTACVLAHLRPVKDPFLPARAVRRLPIDASVRVLHAGRALTDREAARAKREAARTHHWRWLGELPRAKAAALLDR